MAKLLGMRFLTSSQVQDEVNRIIEVAAVSSLDAERAIAQIRRHEHSRLLTIGRASRLEVPTV